MNNLPRNQEHQSFEQLKQIDEQGNEFWYARSLAKILDYTDFRNFIKVINKAISACESSGNVALDHIVEVNDMVKIGSNTERLMNSFSLSPYACYLVVQNGDPTKPVIAAGQTACEITGHAILDHFIGVGKMIELGKGGQREIDDVMIRGKQK